MPDHEQQQSDQGFQAGDEQKENWVKPESSYDSDGFVRSPDEVLSARAGKLVSDVVMAKLPDTRDFRQLREDAEDIPRKREDALMRGATARDMKRNAYFGYDTKLRDSDGDETYLSNAEWERKDIQRAYDSEVASVAKPVHELLDLNKEKLINLTVAEFVGLVDKRAWHEEVIINARDLIVDYRALGSDIRRLIDGRGIPRRGRGDTYTTTEQLSELHMKGRNAGIDSDPDTIKATDDKLRALEAKAYDVSPREFLGECAEITEADWLRIDAKLPEYEKELEEFDARITSGDFYSEPVDLDALPYPADNQQDVNSQGQQHEATAA